MSSRTGACPWVVVVLLVAPTSAAAQALTTRDVVEAVVRDGPRARAIRAGLEVVRLEQAARLAYPNPAVHYGREGAGFTEFYQVEQPLPAFGVRTALQRAGIAATAAAEAERDARLWQLRKDAEAAVARLVAGQSRVDAAEAHGEAVARLIDVLRVREREGEGSRFDRLRAEQELRETRVQITAAGASVAELRAGLAALLPPGLAFSRLADEPPRASDPPALEDLFQRATTGRSELRALQQVAERADREADAARQSRLPWPVVIGGVKRADAGSGRETGGVVGISAQVPLFDRGSRDAARWLAERQRADAERQAIEQQIRGEIAGAAQVVALRAAAVVGEMAADEDELARVADVAYREGEVGILELLDASRTGARARARRIEARLELRLAQIALERAVGDTLWP